MTTIRSTYKLTKLGTRLLQGQRGLATVTKIDHLDQLETTPRPFSALPQHKKWQLIRDFMPGGQFANVSMLEYANAMRDKHGDIFLMPGIFGRPDLVMTFNPKDIETVFRSEGQWPVREGFDSIVYFREKVRADVYGDMQGLLATQGEQWGKLRTVMNPILMQPRNLKMYIEPLSHINNEFIERIKEIRDPQTLEVPANFEEEICRLIFESIALIALNREMGIIRKKRDNAEALKLFNTSRLIFRYIYQLDLQPSMWKYIRTPVFNKMMQVLDESLNITMKMVQETREILEERKKNDQNIEQNFSIFEKLVSIDEKIATIMSMDILFAGVDATSTFFAAILLCLSKNPEKQQKLREEVFRVMPTKHTALDESRMRDMPYMRAIIKETLRYYPNGLGTLRNSIQDIVLSGYTIPKGTRVLVGSNLLMKDESYYTRANDFLPERWLRTPGTQNKIDVSPFSFLPFGFGPRMCLGKRIVDLEIEISLAKLIRNFYVEFNYDATKPFRSFFVMEPAIPFKFKFTDVEE